MEEFINSITSTPALALGVAIIIFLVAVVLVIKRIIGFFITLLLLFFAIVSGYAILNHDIVRNWLDKMTKDKDTTTEEDQSFKATILKAYEELKEQIDSFIKQNGNQEQEPERKNSNQQPRKRNNNGYR